ncbi:MAG: AI-2E family transporter [Actinomycetia bacterium]|nr:AI-2E family transporter [Actinomycetes bacterium]
MGTTAGDRERAWATWLALGRDAVIVVVGAGLVLSAVWRDLGRIGGLVLVLVVSVILSILLGPSVDMLARRAPRWAAVTLVVLGGAAVVLSVGGWIAASLVTQLIALAGQIPDQFARLQTSAPALLAWIHHLGLRFDLANLENRVINSAGTVSAALLNQIFHLVTALVSGIGDVILTLFLTFYLILDAERIQRGILRLVPAGHRDALLALQRTVSHVIRGYVRGQLMLSGIMGLTFGVGSWMIGLPFPLVVGVLAAFLEFIPLLGPVLAAVLPLILAFFGRPETQVPELLTLYVGAHVVESQFLAPRIFRNQVGLHPVLSVLALVIGASLQGIWGAFFAVPAAGIVVAAWTAANRVWRERVVLAGPGSRAEPREEDRSPARR